MTTESKLIREALNTPYQEWRSIEPLMDKTKDAHTKEMLRRLMMVKLNRVKNGR